MHNSMLSQRSQWTLLEEQGKQLLNDNERATMNYYISEYEHDNVSVSSLVLALLELLNTRAKVWNLLIHAQHNIKSVLFDNVCVF